MTMPPEPRRAEARFDGHVAVSARRGLALAAAGLLTALAEGTDEEQFAALAAWHAARDAADEHVRRNHATRLIRARIEFETH